MSRPVNQPTLPDYSRHKTPNAAHQAKWRHGIKPPKTYDPQRWANEKHVVPKLAPRVPLDLSNDPAVALYRATKAAKGDRMAPVLAEAKEAFQRLMEANQPHKAGRPKGSRNGAWKSITVGKFANG
jgi:hypothetical protein